MIFSGGENGRGDWVDFKPYVQGKREKPFTGDSQDQARGGAH